MPDSSGQYPTGLIEGLDRVESPSLLFDAEAIVRNIERMLVIAGGDPKRLRPHLKTHKCAEILRLQLERGIDRAKCATIAEAELAAGAGVPDVLIAYPLVGPNAARLAELVRRFPETRFSGVADSAAGVSGLSTAATSAGVEVATMIDFDCGMHRTGAAPEAATSIVRQILDAPGLVFAGVHAYDGHIHDTSLETRREKFDAAMAETERFLAELEADGIDVPLVVSGGSPTFAMHAEHAASSGRLWECSPGTTLLWDAGYDARHAELGFEPAAFLLTRVVSHPGKDLVCLDLGHKAVAAENPLDRRVVFPDLPEVRFLSQSEEHLVVTLPGHSTCPIGSEVIGIPIHVCPTVALYQRARIIREDRVTDEEWEITARDRRIGV